MPNLKTILLLSLAVSVVSLLASNFEVSMPILRGLQLIFECLQQLGLPGFKRNHSRVPGNLGPNSSVLQNLRLPRQQHEESLRRLLGKRVVKLKQQPPPIWKLHKGWQEWPPGC